MVKLIKTGMSSKEPAKEINIFPIINFEREILNEGFKRVCR